MTDSIPVRFEVLGVEAVRGAGRLEGLANVLLDVAGLELRLQGVGLIRGADERLSVRGPVWRHPQSGRWLPALLLPDQLTAAIAAELLAMAGEGS